MMITRTSAGTVLIQSGDDAVELTATEVPVAAGILASYAEPEMGSDESTYWHGAPYDYSPTGPDS
jgi:hypothetical protein